MINPLLTEKALENWLNIFITAFGETLKNISIGFTRQGSNFIQTNHSGMQLLGDYRDILALKNLEEILKGIDDIARKKISSRTNLIRVIPSFWLQQVSL